MELHNHLRDEFLPHILGNALIEQPPTFRGNERWTKSHVTGRIEFHLWTEPISMQVRAKPHLRRGPVQQLRGVQDDLDAGWVAWREGWERREAGLPFELRDASFTFLWGTAQSVDVILFRSEWCGDGAGAEHSGHPHWQVDAVDLNTAIGNERFHFSMAGWEATTNCPSCFQRFPSEIAHLRLWASRTLEYCRGELERYPPHQQV